jgi:hypothetical protein
MSKDSHEALLKQLKNPFDEKFVKWRVGATNKDKTKGIALAYIDSREVMKRLDEVCEIGGWRKRLVHFPNGFICEIDIRVEDEWITRSDAGAYTHVEPEKGGASDAFKRAAANWGIGRYLYYLPNIWVPIVPQGKSYILAEVPELPNWAKPNPNIENWQDVAEMEVDATSGFDEQEVITNVISSLNKINDSQTIEELNQIVGDLSTEEQIGLASQINLKTKDLLYGKQRKAQSSNC